MRESGEQEVGCEFRKERPGEGVGKGEIRDRHDDGDEGEQRTGDGRHGGVEGAYGGGIAEIIGLLTTKNFFASLLTQGDDLGRVVIPKEIRRTMRIREGDPSWMMLTRFCDGMLALARRSGE